MDYDDSRDDVSERPVPVSAGPVYVEKPRKRSVWRALCRIFFVFSILGNVFLILLLGMTVILLGGGGSGFYENTIREGDPSVSAKIAVIRLEGIIDGEMSDNICKQLRKAAEDLKVKAVILRTNSPGGAVSASDQIHHEIMRLRESTGKPVVAFMQTIAASGGYYTSVACDKIIAEPTVITGSIGVIMNHVVLKKLLEEKLGISPVVIKSGEKKDWPSPFNETSEEEKKYLYDKLVSPAYGRFVGLVAEGRQQHLSYVEVKNLADGSIYSAQEALDVHLIDEVGYLEDAILLAESLAGVKGTDVIEYFKPSFSFASMMGVESKLGFSFDMDTLQELTTPRLEYRWRPGE